MAHASYDIVIIGAGPAGSHFARTIDTERYRVLLLDASSMRHKVCAGLLSPDAQKLLKRYNITLPSDVFVDPQLSSVRVIDLNLPHIRHYRRSYLNVDRSAFDAHLLGLVPASVSIARARCHSIRRTKQGFLLEIHHTDGRREQVATQYVVGADGTSSLVRRSLFSDEHIQTYVSIQQWFAADTVDPYYSCVFDHTPPRAAPGSFSRTVSWSLAGHSPLAVAARHLKNKSASWQNAV